MPRKPKLGQNFLSDPDAQQRIAAALGDISDKTIVEIGPGRGAITDLLAPRAHRLILVELDRALAAELRFRFRDQPQVEVHEADILLTDLSQFGTGLQVVGNLPYYITSDILLHLFAHSAHIDRAVLMMQREVADRVAAEPGSRDYGLLSATTALYATSDMLFTLPPSAFSPPPEVHSSVIRLHFAPHFEALGVAPETFIPFLRQSFAQKRKTLANNLRHAGYSPEQLATRWPPQIPQQARAEAVSLADMAALFQALTCSAQPGFRNPSS